MDSLASDGDSCMESTAISSNTNDQSIPCLSSDNDAAYRDSSHANEKLSTDIMDVHELILRLQLQEQEIRELRLKLAQSSQSGQSDLQTDNATSASPMIELKQHLHKHMQNIDHIQDIDALSDTTADAADWQYRTDSWMTKCGFLRPAYHRQHDRSFYLHSNPSSDKIGNKQPLLDSSTAITTPISSPNASHRRSFRLSTSGRHRKSFSLRSEMPSLDESLSQLDVRLETSIEDSHPSDIPAISSIIDDDNAAVTAIESLINDDNVDGQSLINEEKRIISVPDNVHHIETSADYEKLKSDAEKIEFLLSESIAHDSIAEDPNPSRPMHLDLVDWLLVDDTDKLLKLWNDDAKQAAQMDTSLLNGESPQGSPGSINRQLSLDSYESDGDEPTILCKLPGEVGFRELSALDMYLIVLQDLISLRTDLNLSQS